MTSLGIQQRPADHRQIGRSPLLLSHKQRSSSSLPLLKHLHQAGGAHAVAEPQTDPSLDGYFSLLQRLKEETSMYKQNKELKQAQSRKPWCKQQPHSPPLPSPLPRGPSSRVPPLPGVPTSSRRVLPSGRTQRRLSQHSSHKMASSSSSQKGKHTPAIIKGHRHLSYGGSVPPENITIQQFYDLTPTKKSNVRLNDQLIPKPTDINIAEIMITVPIPKEHPYQAHISRFALFPTFRSPDDPDTGVRAASLRPLNPLVPASAPEVTVLRKTKGGPYRHEVLEAPMTTRKKTISWPGQHGFLDHPVKGEAQTQVFYPKSQKTVFPNPTLRDWEVTLSERTANMLRNVEKSHWVTSYQLHYTGTGPTNPLRLDDFHENTIDMITGKITPYTTQLRERSHPVLLPPKPRDGRKARIRQGRHTVESTYHSPVTAPAAESHSADQTSTQNHPAGPLGTMCGHQSHQEIKGNASTQDGHPINSHSHSELSLFRPGAGDVSGPGPGDVSGPGPGDVSGPEPAQVSGYVFPGHHLQDQGSRCERCGEERCECQVKEAREGLHHPGPGAIDPQQSNQAPRASLEKGVVEKVTDTESSLALYSRQLPHPPLNETTEVTNENNTQREVWYEDVPSSKKQSYTASGGNPFSLSQPAPALATNNTGAAYESETELSAADLVSPNIRNWRSSGNLVLGSEMTANQTLEQQDREWQNREIPIPRSISNPCIQPRPHALPSTHPGERGRGRCQLALLELQDSFSKSEVHRLFHSSLQGGAVNLQDNVHTGRKHRFYGFNSFYYHN